MTEYRMIDLMIQRLEQAGASCEFMALPHNASTCREAAALIKRLRGLLQVAKCPDDACGGQGWSAHQIADDEWEQQQCQWCYEKAEALKQDDGDG